MAQLQIHSRARTKIVATVGPACASPEMMAKLVQAGVDVFRVNMAHGSREEHTQTVRKIRSVSRELDQVVGILVDLAGPKIRLGTLREDPLDCPLDAEFTFIRGEESLSPSQLTSNYEPLIDELGPGDSVMLADGTVGMQVISVENDQARCRVVESGKIRTRQGINLPGVKLSTPALTEEDLDNARWAAEMGIDFVGLSFVRSPQEIEQLKTLLRDNKSRALVVAKVEKREALDALDAVVSAADAVMVARGDLGVETDVAEIAVEQKRIVAACRRFGKPVIIATQMLDSMQHSRRPTRAEATDVANAILDGADACMLSGETAVGDYPLEAVKMMERILRSTERMLQSPAPDSLSDDARLDVHPVTSAVTWGAARIAQRLSAKLVVIASRSGATARVKSKQRDIIPSIGVSQSEATLRQMTLYWGINPLPGAPLGSPPELRRFIDHLGQEDGSLKIGDRVVFVTGTGLVPGAHNTVVVHDVE